jgi:hypothetical protein
VEVACADASIEELEALIEEARRRQRRRRRRVGAALLLALTAFGLGLYLAAARVGGGSAPAHPSRPAAVRSATRPEIVFAADRAAVRYGEIYVVDSSGKRIDLSRSPAQDISPAVSPDGRWVVHGDPGAPGRRPDGVPRMATTPAEAGSRSSPHPRARSRG